MAMAVVIVAGLVFRRGLKAMTYHKAQLNKQAQRIVKRGTTYREIVVVSQFVAKLLQGEMPCNAIHRIEDGKALWRLPALVQFQIAGQDILDRCLNVFSHFMWS